MDAARPGRPGRGDDGHRDLQLQLQPGGEQDGRRAVARTGHLDAGDGLVRRLVECRGELVPPQRQAGPREVGVARHVGLPERLDRAVRVLLRGGVGDAALRDPAQRGRCRLLRSGLRPPRDDRSVRQQQARDQALLVGRGLAVGAEDDDLARARVAADADLRVETTWRLRVAVVLRHDDHAHRVLARRLVRGRDRLFLVAQCRRDDERQHAAEGDGAALLADVHELLLDLRHRGVRHVDLHGRLQVRPSRASRASADAGPHVPGRYCSGWPCVAQNSSIGSRIFHDSSTSW